MAQLANRLGDVPLSVKYLERAIQTTKNVLNQDEIPLAETYLNVANAHSFLSKYEEAIKFADQAE